MKLIFVLVLLVHAIILFFASSQESQGNPHGDIQFDCADCHGVENWQVKTDSLNFDHSRTGFPLTGVHKVTDCRDCHTSLVFNHIGVSCVDCHTDIHKGEFGFVCQNCHAPQTWENRQDIFENHSETRFPLLGVHALVDCESCHSTTDPFEYKTVTIECSGCHLQEFNLTENPDHRLAQFSTDCEMCHSIAAVNWQQSNYSHPPPFVLRGAHIQTDCSGCHTNSYTGTPNRCEDCHMDAYNASTEPNHPVFGFPTDCAHCHNENSWHDAQFDHVAESGFELRGVHATIQCNTCHVNNQLSGLPRDCYGCHESDYLAVNDPNHVTARFSHNCMECHSELAWSPSTFDHDQTQFQLSGAHISVACGDCHINGQFSGTPTDCWSCHENDYLAVNDPNHSSGQFSHDCLACHSDVSWSPATFDHDQTQFALTGAHVSVNCEACHVNGQYTGLPSECVSCHENEYNATTDPNHMAAGFPLQCENCHNTISWEDANWDHDSQFFPIYTGRHREAWEVCADCHIAPGDYKQFECIICHEHNNQADLADKHKEESEYTFQSSACYDCHPRGIAEDD
jgi:hypothetical protein